MKENTDVPSRSIQRREQAEKEVREKLEDIQRRLNSSGYLWDDGLEAREDVRYLLTLLPNVPNRSKCVLCDKPHLIDYYGDTEGMTAEQIAKYCDCKSQAPPAKEFTLEELCPIALKAVIGSPRYDAVHKQFARALLAADGLVKYAVHRASCNWLVYFQHGGDQRPCSCGLVQALDTYGKAKESR